MEHDQTKSMGQGCSHQSHRGSWCYWSIWWQNNFPFTDMTTFIFSTILFISRTACFENAGHPRIINVFKTSAGGGALRYQTSLCWNHLLTGYGNHTFSVLLSVNLKLSFYKAYGLNWLRPRPAFCYPASGLCGYFIRA